MITYLKVIIFSKIKSFLGVISLKISFFFNLIIFFYLNIKYLDSSISISLSLNIINVSNKDIILTCFDSYLSCLQLRLLDIEGADTKSTYIIDFWIKNTYTRIAYLY